MRGSFEVRHSAPGAPHQQRQQAEDEHAERLMQQGRDQSGTAEQHDEAPEPISSAISASAQRGRAAPSEAGARTPRTAASTAERGRRGEQAMGEMEADQRVARDPGSARHRTAARWRRRAQRPSWSIIAALTIAPSASSQATAASGRGRGSGPATLAAAREDQPQHAEQHAARCPDAAPPTTGCSDRAR